jgi:hypothetical protein
MNRARPPWGKDLVEERTGDRLDLYLHAPGAPWRMS